MELECINNEYVDILSVKVKRMNQLLKVPSEILSISIWLLFSESTSLFPSLDAIVVSCSTIPVWPSAIVCWILVFLKSWPALFAPAKPETLSGEYSFVGTIAQSLLAASYFLLVELMTFSIPGVASSMALLSAGAIIGIRGVRLRTAWFRLFLTNSEETKKLLKLLRQQIIQ